MTPVSSPGDLVERIEDHLASPHEAPAINDRLLRESAARIRELEAANASLVDALTPSAETKAAYIGEFAFNFVVWDPEGEYEITHHPVVPWTTIKEIMAAIRARSALTQDGEKQ